MSFIFLFINLTTCVIITTTILYMFGDYYFNKNKKSKFPLSFILIISVIIYFAGLVLTHYVANNYFIQEKVENPNEITNKLENSGLLGDSAGVINALFSALVLGGAIYTLNLQRKEMDDNQKKIALEKFETRFYEMIRLHKQNVDEIIVDDLKGRRAIEHLFKNLSEIYKKVENAILQIENVNSENNPEIIERINRIKNYLSDRNRKLSYIHELSYGYLFYGIENYLVTRDKSDVRFDLNAEITTVLIFQKTHISLLTPRNSLLSHYFRHLYQTVQFVANEETIEEKDRSKYIKLIRAQLSDFEQVLLYYNSLSPMGAKWISPIGERTIEKMCPIARFRLIKNIPFYINYPGIKPEELFKTEKEIWEKEGFKFFELDIK